MSTDNDTRRRWGLPVSRTELDDEIAEEIAFHLEQKRRRLEESGLKEADARDAALRRFGNVTAIRNACLDLSHRAEKQRMRLQILDEFWLDVKLALRGLQRRPVFALSAVLTLALGLGATTAMVSLMDAVFVRALPYDKPERLVSLWDGMASQAIHDGFAQLEELDDVAGFYADFATLTGVDSPARLPIAEVTTNFFRTLGVQPILGRGFLDADGEPGAPETVVLAEPFWRRQFQADRDVIDTVIRLDGRPHQIVGVMPARLALPAAETLLWTPTEFASADSGYYWGQSYLQLFGRLEEGVDADRLALAGRTALEGVRLANPIWTPGEGFADNVEVRPFQAALAGGIADLLRLLFYGVLAVLLVVCVNVAGLFVSKAKSQEQEAAIRTSLGAGRLRLIGQSLIEAWVVALLGSVLGLSLAIALLSWLPNALPGLEGRFGTIGIDTRMMIFSFGLSILTALAFGIAPALRSSRSKNLSAAVRGQRGFSRRDRTGPLLVVAQLALTVLLLTGAALLGKGVLDQLRLETGIETSKVIAAAVHPASGDYSTFEARSRLTERILGELRTSTLVESVATASTLPFGTTYWTAFDAPDRNLDPNALPSGPYRHVTPGYFSTLGIPILRGREFDDRDTYTENTCSKEAPCVAVVDRDLAEQIWPGDDALERMIGADWLGWYRIVGIAAKAPVSLNEDDNGPTLYLPQIQRPQLAMNVVVRSRAGAREVEREIRSAVASIDPQIPVSEVRSMDDDIWRSIATSRLAATLIGAFAFAALFLAGIGIYGVMSYRAQQRRREMGIRLALGSTAANLRRRELVRVALIALQGLAVGGLLTFFAIRFLGATTLLESTGIDGGFRPGLWLLTALVLLGVALLAGYGPARRASRLDPSEVLSVE